LPDVTAVARLGDSAVDEAVAAGAKDGVAWGFEATTRAAADGAGRSFRRDGSSHSNSAPATIPGAIQRNNGRGFFIGD
jgi:hypothetical protein